ncbi:Hpt domain-containing protein [Mycetocola sp.]|uniref:Hpt domain-containing protein n=1 Tax=Mycetocola sp. TaxID=1871042 RepID=UPI0039890975
MVIFPLATTFAPDDTGHPPLLDLAVLDVLLDELDHNEAGLDAFLEAFISLWPTRLRRAQESVRAGDLAALQDSALSIKVSCQMVGASRLSGCGARLESLVESNRIDGAPALIETLRLVGEQTLAALADVRDQGQAS